MEERNYGIDALRILAMFFVVMLHSLGRGGILANAIVNSSQYKLAWILEIIGYCAVNLFALISGYVSYDKKHEAKNYINLWFYVVYYCLFIVLIYQIINPSIITTKDYIKAFFPITNSTYWYFTAYTGLFIIKPLLDKGINYLEKKDLKRIFWLIIIVFSVYDTFVKRFTINNGYSVIWLIILYILGAIISKCEIGKNLKTYKAIGGIVIFVLITYLFKIYVTSDFIFFKNYFDINVDNNLFINYTSFPILGIAILFLIIFSKIHFSKSMIKVIEFGATSAFSVYLLNTHYLVWDNFMLDLFKNIANSGLIEIGFKVIGFSLIFVICAILIDKLRILLFKILKINKLSEKISSILNI